MSTIDECRLTEMAVDELWDLHQCITAILASKLEAQKSELDKRLRRLQPNAVLKQPGVSSRRPYPAVTQKFRNPAQPDQTWSGRGKRPRWVTELLNAGMSVNDFQIPEVTASQI
jgi:DNA-binding protein H-NS